MPDQFRSMHDETSKPAASAALRALGVRETLPLAVGQTVVLGRQSGTPWINRLLSQFTDVSRRHAEVTLTEGNRVVIRDRDSQHGTFVRGERLIAGTECRVMLPVEIRLGAECFLDLVHGEDPAPGGETGGGSGPR